MDYDFMVGFTIFNASGYKTMFRHFNKLETAELFASNINLKNNCKIYIDYLYYKELERKIKAIIEECEKEKENAIRMHFHPYNSWNKFECILQYNHWNKFESILQTLLEKEE